MPVTWRAQDGWSVAAVKRFRQKLRIPQNAGTQMRWILRIDACGNGSGPRFGKSRRKILTLSFLLPTRLTLGKLRCPSGRNPLGGITDGDALRLVFRL